MINFKPTFFTSDWHIGHEAAIRFDERPFQSLYQMHNTLIARYNATVPINGVCYFLGDVGNKHEDVRKVISSLNGTKVLVLGNHDGKMTSMYNCGFDVVVYSASIYIGDDKVNMTHCPYIGIKREDTSKMKDPTENWHGENREKHRRHAMMDDGGFLLHGHIHSRKDKEQSKKILGRQFDVGVTANNYTPVSISSIESWITLYKKENA